MDIIKSLRSFENDESGYIGWIPGWDYMNGKGNYNSNITFSTWGEFFIAWSGNDTEYNTVVNFYFSENFKVEDFNNMTLNLWVLHPRKGASRAVVIENVYEEDLPSIKAYLKKHFEQIRKWFEWVDE